MDPVKAKRWLPAFKYFCSLVSVVSKELEAPGPITLYTAQNMALDEIESGLAEDVRFFTILKARQLGLCLDPETRVLTADLRWVTIRELETGDEVVSVDESPSPGKGGARRMRTAKVVAKRSTFQKAYRITLDDGRSVTCSSGHRWLSKNRHVNGPVRWRAVERDKLWGSKLKPGYWIRWITTPWDDGGYEDGWFGGLLDGEGSISLPSRSGAQICVSQKPGAVWDRMESYCQRRGYSYRKEDDNAVRLTKYGKTPVPKIALTRMDEILRLLGQTRPSRFIKNRFWEGKELPGKGSGTGWARIVSIDELQDQELVDIQTTTGTFIAEGFVSHNSTILILLDMFWLYMHPGLQGAFVCDTAENREIFRETIKQMMASLPKGFQIPTVKHDRTMLVLENGSRLQYMSAGTGKNAGLGRSRGLNFLHATELGRWGDPKGYETLVDTLAQENKNRLYLIESTALGFNLFYDCWKDTLAAPESRRAIFIGWWAKEPYSFAEGTAQFDRWWGAYPAYTEYEQRITLEVHAKYGIEITPEKWAWYRSVADGRAEQNVNEEYPSNENEAFQSGGYSFFDHKRITADTQYIGANDIAFIGYRYELGENFLKMRMRVAQSVEEVQLRVWEKPQPNAKYVIGVDPAFGSSEDADSTVIGVWRCFSDQLVQVAEYASPLTTTQNCAWVLGHLAGEYRDVMINLEYNGGGGEVAMEMKHLRQSIQFGGLMNAARDMKVEHALDSARWFYWRRPDSIGGQPSAHHFTTNGQNKPIALNRMNDAYLSGQLIVRSIPLLEEMTTMRREGDKIAASGRSKDDRVMSCMLATYAWKEWIQPGMMSSNRTFDREMREQLNRQAAGTDVLAQIVPQFLQEQAERRGGISLKALLEGPLQ